MSRSLSEIYQQAVGARNERLELNEIDNGSKVSVMNALTWIMSYLVYGFEVLLDVFTVDIATTINNRINGTPAYYVNALKKYQKGHELQVNAEGTGFGYGVTDETTRIVTQVSYSEAANADSLDNRLILRAATGSPESLSRIGEEDLEGIQAYLQKIKFAGTKVTVISRNGDILLPKMTVFHDGAVPKDELLDAIDKRLFVFITNLRFDSALYVSEVIEAVRSVDHVRDVYIDEDEGQGIYLVQYDDLDNPEILGKTQLVKRMTHTLSGYLKQSTKQGQEKNVPRFRECIKLVIDTGCDTDCLLKD